MPEFMVLARKAKPLWTHRIVAASAGAAVRVALFRQLTECWRRGADFEISALLTIRPPGVASDSEDELYDWAELSLANVVLAIKRDTQFPADFVGWAEEVWKWLHRTVQADATLCRVREMMTRRVR